MSYRPQLKTANGVSDLPLDAETVKGSDIVDSNGNIKANKIPNLDASKIVSGTIDASLLPAIAITDTFVVNTQAAMLALTAQIGDVAVRTDLNKSYILKEADASVLSHWQELLSPPNAVVSVNNKTGAVSLTASDVGAVSSNSAITGATKCKITYDSKGLVTGGDDLSASDIPNLDASKLTSGTLPNARLSFFWDANTTYSRGALVYYSNNWWVLNADSNKGSTPGALSLYWQWLISGASHKLYSSLIPDLSASKIASGTLDKARMPSELQKLMYNSSTTYSANDICIYSGKMFVSLVDSNKNNTPSTSADTSYWARMFV